MSYMFDLIHQPFNVVLILSGAESDDDADSGSDEDEQYDARRRAYKAPAPRKVCELLQ